MFEGRVETSYIAPHISLTDKGNVYLASEEKHLFSSYYEIVVNLNFL